VAEQAAELARNQSVAVLLRKRQVEKEFVRKLLQAGCLVRRLRRDAKRWTFEPTVWVGTFHAAKGLEFDAVLIPRCDDDKMPDPHELAVSDNQDRTLSDEARLLYVGVTRAKSSLLLFHTTELTRLLPRQDDLYEAVDLSG